MGAQNHEMYARMRISRERGRARSNSNNGRRSGSLRHQCLNYWQIGCTVRSLTADMGSGHIHAESDHGKCSLSPTTEIGNQGSRTRVRSSIVLAMYRRDEPEWQLVSCRRRLAKNEPYHCGLQLGLDYSHDNMVTLTARYTSFRAAKKGYIAC